MTMLTMSTIWGWLEHIGEAPPDSRWIQIRTVLAGGPFVRICVVVEERTRIARGIEPIEFSQLQEGELVEIVYHCSHSGFMAAEQIYVRPDRFAVA